MGTPQKVFFGNCLGPIKEMKKKKSFVKAEASKDTRKTKDEQAQKSRWLYSKGRELRGLGRAIKSP